MIVRLRGKVVSVEVDAVVVDVTGVGYKVHVPASVAQVAGAADSDITLHTRMRVSDSDITLFGAVDPDAMRLFDELVSVSGIGPRLAMAMLSAFDPAALANAIAAEDAELLTQTPGVGRKTAQRVVLELKSKVVELSLTAGSEAMSHAGVSLDDEAVEALMALGYSSAEARRAVAASGASDEEVLEERLRAALRWLSG